MSPCKREFPVVVIVRSADSSCRMAFVAREARIGVSSDISVFAVHIRLVVIMAVYAAECLITWGRIVTIGAGAPCPCMFS